MEMGPLTISHSEEPVQPTLVCFSATLLQFPGQTIAHSLSQKGDNEGRGQCLSSVRAAGFRLGSSCPEAIGESPE